MSTATRATLDSNLLFENDPTALTDVRRHSKYSHFIDFHSERLPNINTSEASTETYKTSRTHIFSHFSKWRQIWEYIILFVSGSPIIEVSFICIYSIDMPFYFYIPFLIFDLLFAFDYYVVTHTEYLSHGVPIRNIGRITHRYGTRAQWLHCIGALPISWIGLLYHKWWVFLLFSSTRFLRLHRFIYAIDTLMTSLRYYSWASAFFPLLFLLLVCIHIFASMFYLSAYFEGVSNSWIGILEWDYLSKPQQYILSIYFVMTTILTIGFGDLTPQTSPETLLVIFIQLSGVMVNAYIVSIMVKYLIDPIGNYFLTGFHGLQYYMKFKQVNEEIQKDAIFYSQDTWDKGGGALEPEDVFKFVPETVRNNLKKALAENCFKRSGLLASSSKTTQNIIADILRPVKFVPGEIIFSKDEIRNEMLLLNKGYINNGGLEAFCNDGYVTGEIDLFIDSPKLASLVSLSYTSGWVIRREDLLMLIGRRPEIRKELLLTCKTLYPQHYKQIRRLLYNAALNINGRTNDLESMVINSESDSNNDNKNKLFDGSSSSDENALSS